MEGSRVKSPRDDFLTAYTAHWGCARIIADRHLRTIELTYAETQNAALMQQVDDMAGQEMKEESEVRKGMRTVLEAVSDALREAGVEHDDRIQGVKDLAAELIRLRKRVRALEDVLDTDCERF